MIKVTVWNEYIHEKSDEKVREIYPHGIHNYIKSFLDGEEDFTVKAVSPDDPEHGLSDELLDNTDVLLWWAHIGHSKVPDDRAKKVVDRVLSGMGIIFLHSAHKSKPMMSLLGTTCSLAWREGSRERLWCCNPSHPIAQGLPEHIEIPQEEMYGEHFDIPQPEELVYLGWYKTGEVFRSVITYTRGYGKIVYIQPGHETNPTYHIPEIQQLIKNAVRYAKPCVAVRPTLECIGEPAPLENIK